MDAQKELLRNYLAETRGIYLIAIHESRTGQQTYCRILVSRHGWIDNITANVCGTLHLRYDVIRDAYVVTGTKEPAKVCSNLSDALIEALRIEYQPTVIIL